MGFFRRRQQEPAGNALPPNIVSLMERFGRYEMDPEGSGEDSSKIWMETQSPLRPFATSDPEGFLIALAGAAVPVGGYAVYGASRTLFEFIKPPFDKHPAYIAIMTGAIQFLRANGVPPMRVRPYEWQHWADMGGTRETWLPRRPTPLRDEAPITSLRPGETRKVAQLISRPDSNIILVRQRDDGRYCALIDARQSDEDPTRSQWEWKSAESLYELYIEIGLSQQTPTYWYNPELEPYFPLPRPKI